MTQKATLNTASVCLLLPRCTHVTSAIPTLCCSPPPPACENAPVSREARQDGENMPLINAHQWLRGCEKALCIFKKRRKSIFNNVSDQHIQLWVFTLCVQGKSTELVQFHVRSLNHVWTRMQLWRNRSVEQLSLRRDNKRICYLLIPWLCLYLQDSNWIREVFLMHCCREEKVALQEPQSCSQCKVCVGIQPLSSDLSVTGWARPAVRARKMAARYGSGVFAVLRPTAEVQSAEKIISLKSISSFVVLVHFLSSVKQPETQEGNHRWPSKNARASSGDADVGQNVSI